MTDRQIAAVIALVLGAPAATACLVLAVLDLIS